MTDVLAQLLTGYNQRLIPNVYYHSPSASGVVLGAKYPTLMKAESRGITERTKPEDKILAINQSLYLVQD